MWWYDQNTALSSLVSSSSPVLFMAGSLGWWSPAVFTAWREASGRRKFKEVGPVVIPALWDPEAEGACQFQAQPAWDTKWDLISRQTTNHKWVRRWTVAHCKIHTMWCVLYTALLIWFIDCSWAFFFKQLFPFTCLCTCTCVLLEPVLSCHVDSRDQTVKLAGKCLRAISRPPTPFDIHFRWFLLVEL